MFHFDPSRAGAVALALIGLSVSPAVAASGLEAAQAAGARIGERLEQLRDPSAETPRLDVDLRLERATLDQPADPWLAPSPEPESVGVDPGRFELRPVPVREMRIRSDGSDPDPSGFWSRGAADLAREGSGFLDLEGSLAALSTGFDAVTGDGGARGVAASFDRGRFDGASGVGTQSGVAAYGTLQPVPGGYLDVLAGTVADPDAADGDALFYGSATFGLERRQDGWLVAPYGRVETAGAIEAPETLGGRAVMGLRTEAAFDVRGTRLRPQLRLEAERAGTPGRGLTAGRTTTIAPALRADFSPDWNARVEHRSVIGANARENRLELRVTGRF